MTTKHITHYSYNGRTCLITHLISPASNKRRGDQVQRTHQRIVEEARPKRPGDWKMVDSGGCGDDVDYLGREYTYWAKWVRR